MQHGHITGMHPTIFVKRGSSRVGAISILDHQVIASNLNLAFLTDRYRVRFGVGNANFESRVGFTDRMN
jgi:hypothetical protein